MVDFVGVRETLSDLDCVGDNVCDRLTDGVSEMLLVGESDKIFLNLILVLK